MPPNNDRTPKSGGAPSSDNRFFRHGGGPTLQGVANLINDPQTRNVMILAGAGISTSATPPIPDFRTKGTGLYDNLAKYDLPFPEAIFDIGYFQEKPQPFFTLAKELYPGNFKPSLTHYFFQLLNQKGKLGTVFTQNVDTLERIAGLPDDRIIEAHGSFATAACIKCRSRVEPAWMRSKVMAGEIARCEAAACRKRGRPGLVKPDIVFFGEGLPDRFFKRIKDLRSADLLIVVGTSLQVQPFASLVDAVPSMCPRVLINLERVGELAGYDSSFAGGGMGGRMNESGFDFDGLTHGGRQRTRDVYWEGKADEGVLLLAQALGWEEELLKLKKESFARLDREWGTKDTKSAPTSDEKSSKTAEAVKEQAETLSSQVGKSAATATFREAGDPVTTTAAPKDDDDDEQQGGAADDLAAKLERTTLDPKASREALEKRGNEEKEGAHAEKKASSGSSSL